MNNTPQIVAKESTAKLRLIAKSDIDRDTARVIHADILSVVAEFARKHGFKARKVRRTLVVVK